MMSGLRREPGAIDGASDGFADDGAHGAADEAVLHGAEDNLMRAQAAEWR